MVFTGYLLDELRARRDPAVDALLAAVDLLVDGPFDRTRAERTRRWIGSKNQTLHFLTDRYVPTDPRFHAPNELVITLDRRALSVHGFPSAQVVSRRTREPSA
jgi:anaerobic ribonucleoside-triphosphate reductase activating protein